MNAVLIGLQNIGTWSTGSVVVALSLAGVLTMAILQTFKDITPIRRWFQQDWVDDWLRNRAAMFNANTAGLQQVVARDARRTLIELATGGAQAAFYDLQAEQLVAQMNSAAQIALDYPSADHYYSLLVVLSQGADLADVALVHSVPTARGIVDATGQLPPGYADARNRVSHRIQRNLDGLQIAMSDRWQWWLQIAAIVLSTALIEIAIFIQPSAPELFSAPGTTAFVLGLLVGVVGGYLAPVTRDLVAALQNLRKP